MAYLKFNGAELGTTSLMEIIALSGTASAQTSIMRSGAYAWRFNPSASTGFVSEQFYDNNTQGVTKHLLWFYIPSIGVLPSAETKIWELMTTGDAVVVNMTIDTIGQLRFRNGALVSSTQVGSTYSIVPTGQWFSVYIEFDCTTLASSTLLGEVDGAAWTTTSTFTASNGVARRRVGVLNTCTADLYNDDNIIADGATTIDRLTKLLDLAVAGDADTSLRGTQGTDWDTGPSTGGTAWQQLDEVPTPNDDTDYDELITASAGSSSAPILDFSLADPAAAGIGASDTIKFLAVHTRHRAETASNMSDVLRIKGQSGGTASESAALTYGNVTWMTNRETAQRQTPRLVSLSNPQDGAAWTRATVATAIVGVRATDATPDVWTTKVWVTVGYVVSAGGGPVIPVFMNQYRQRVI